MRVLIYAPNYLPATRYGGPVKSIHGLARGLARQGHEVRVLTSDVDGPTRLDVPLDRPTELDGVHVYYCPIAHPKRIYFSPVLEAMASRLLPESDVVHINGMFLWPGPHLARAARQLSKPVVISPRGMLMPEMIAGKSRLAKWAWIALRERTALRRARAIHVTSGGEAEGLRQVGLDLAPVVEVPNGVNVPKRAPDPDEIDRVWGDVPMGKRVALLARLDWTKGIDLAIEAVRTHPDAVLKIAGYDQIGLRNQLEPRLIRRDGSSAGSFIGPLDGRETWAFLAGADLLLAPSLRESFGMAVAEAMAVGTPAIVTPGVGARDLVAAVDPDLISERTPEALAQTLTTFLADDVRREDAGTLARTIVAEHYTWSSVAERLTRVYAGTKP